MTTALKSPAPTRPARVTGPAEGALAPLWHLAQRKFEARALRRPTTREDWAEVTRDYHRITTKQRGTLGHVIRERCAEQAGAT